MPLKRPLRGPGVTSHNEMGHPVTHGGPVVTAGPGLSTIDFVARDAPIPYSQLRPHQPNFSLGLGVLYPQYRVQRTTGL